MYTLADVTIQSFGMTHICKPLVFTHNPSSIKSTLSHMKKNLWSSRSNVFGVYYLPSTCKSVWGRWRQCIKDVVHKATAKKSKTLTYKDLKWIFTVKNHEKCPLHPLSVHRRSRPYSGPVVDQLSTNQHWADVSCSWDFDALGENPSLLIVWTQMCTQTHLQA